MPTSREFKKLHYRLYHKASLTFKNTEINHKMFYEKFPKRYRS